MRRSRPRRKLSIGGAKLSMAMAVIGPIPGIVCRRRVVAPAEAASRSVLSRSAIFAL